ncbi:predicted protein, partial [Nematostella vectensis]
MRVYNLITILSVVLATQTLGLEGRKRHHRHHHKTKHSPHHKRRLEKSKGLVPLSRDKIEWGNLGQKFTENQLTYKANKVAKVYKNPFLRNEVIHKKRRTAWKRSEGEYGKGEHKGSVGLERKVPQRGSKKEKIHHKSRSKKYELGYPTMQTSQSQSQGYGLGYAGNPMAQLMSQQVTAYQPMGSPGVSAYASSNGGQGADEQGVLQELAAQQKSTTDLGAQQDYQGSQSAEQSSPYQGDQTSDQSSPYQGDRTSDQSSPFQGDQTASYQGSEDQSNYQGSEAGSQTADQGRDSGEQTTAYQGVQTGEQTAAYQGNEAGDQTTAYQGGLAGDQTAAYQGAEGGDPSDSYQGQTSQGFGQENETDDCNGCHHNAKCVKKECICKAGFSGDGTTCRVDNCVNGCSKHGKCIRGFCICDHSHYFNGAECAPYKISHRPCPEACAKRCTDDCPDKCCKVQDATKPSKEENSSKPTNQGGSSNKEVSTFFLKPTGHVNHDAPTSPEHHGKQDEPISHQGNHT